jgi:hypothetical protein
MNICNVTQLRKEIYMMHSIKYMAVLQPLSHLITSTTNFNLLTKIMCLRYIIDVSSLKMIQRRSKHVGVEVLVFYF